MKLKVLRILSVPVAIAAIYLSINLRVDAPSQVLAILIWVGFGFSTLTVSLLAGKVKENNLMPAKIIGKRPGFIPLFCLG